MVCLNCNRDLRECTCPDIDERLSALVNSPCVELTLCTRCGLFGPRCKCPPPATLVSARNPPRRMIN